MAVCESVAWAGVMTTPARSLNSLVHSREAVGKFGEARAMRRSIEHAGEAAQVRGGAPPSL